MSRRRSRRDLFSSGDVLEHLTGLDRLPRAVRLDLERDEDLPALPAHRAPETVYPWASSRLLPDRQRLFSYRPPPAKPRRKARLELGRYSSLRVLQMRVPARVDFCIRRKKRREVLFAFRRAGFRGSAGKRFWRRSSSSSYSC